MERERVRGLFAIGVIAVLYYLHMINGLAPIPYVPANPPYTSGITTDQILAMWGLYVVGMAVALCGDKFTGESKTRKGRAVRLLLEGAYAFARLFYWLAAIFLFIGVFYYIALVVKTFYPFIVAAIIIGFGYSLRKPENREKVRSYWHRTKSGPDLQTEIMKKR